ncbi:hypothetical protein P691DRAFT_71341 [Macrolepiota fuliginosa MF-IS2]|uniref:Uncharacterized protein n=1 Tax=Macrolepiota fuliginosa MF-IS2 TaxID=1400762 RepID=A0A9P5XCB2_9AGAR|nr:hypothetical protein P691DRAFT_71341 [Macrolepiota fuliginosa MF-IS2]
MEPLFLMPGAAEVVVIVVVEVMGGRENELGGTVVVVVVVVIVLAVRLALEVPLMTLNGLDLVNIDGDLEDCVGSKSPRIGTHAADEHRNSGLCRSSIASNRDDG